MDSGQQVPRKARRLGSSRRRQTREPADGQDAPLAPEPESWSSQAAAELQSFFQDCGATERGFVTREDLAMARFSFLGSEEEPEMIFSWVDVEQKGRLSLEEFSSGLKNIFGSSPSSQRLRRRRPLPSKRVSAITNFPALEEVDAEEKEAFLAFVDQLGTSPLLPEQTEIWQLWGKLRQEEPQLAGNLADFLAKMTSRLQEAQTDKEALEQTLRKRDSDHQREVQQLYEEMEQQIRREKQQLQAESDSRGLALSSQMQEALEAKEREVQQLAEGQRELEAKLHHLSSTQQEANSENQQLREAERDLAGQLEEVRGRLQVTRKHLNAARGRVSWQMEEETRQVAAIPGPGAGEMAPGPQAISPEEAPLPRLFGDHEDWGQLLSSIHSPPHRALQLSWSPPSTPRAASGPQTPRVVRQISISEPHTSLFGQEPSLDLDGAPRSPPRVTSSTKDRKEVDPDGQDVNAEQSVENPHRPDPSEEPGSRPKGHFLWGIPEAGESGSLVAAALKVLTPLEGEPPPHVNTLISEAQAGPSKHSDTDDQGPRPEPAPVKPPRQIEVLHHNLYATGSESGAGSQGVKTLIIKPVGFSWGMESVGQDPTEGLGQGKPGLAVQEGHPEELREAPGQVLGPSELPGLSDQSTEEEPKAEEGKRVDQGGQDLHLEQSAEAHGLQTGPLGLPQQDTLPAPLTPDSPQAGPAASAFGKPSPPRSSPPLSSMGTWPGAAAGLQEPTQVLSTTMAELEAHPRPQPMTVHLEEQGPPQSREPRAERRPEDPGTGSREAELTPSLGEPMANQPQANPDYLFHVIFLGDSNVGKTSFLHLLHQNSFATGMTATVGVDFQVKNLLVDNKCFALQLWDTAGQERYHSITRQLLRKADGVVLMYDVTSQESFAHVRYWLDCLQDTGLEGVVILLLGNKTDCEEKRQVPTEAGQQLAQELGVSFGECSAALGHNILEPIVNLARSLKMQEDHLKGSLVEVPPRKPPKKAGCCF
ncbi:ras-related protein Rab-44 [Nycticebus coucang]|uniref:ras-related protein Rab-44 n=1 Tax=Nycticebus coucang TaxID=9470 RepID=UPI00234D6BA0|nr:ras-related protein Rab-44 [Nycticebus coucang]